MPLLMPPRVSVVAQCYNHERFVVECLDSIAAQTYRAFDLLIVDDCSTDQSPALIEAWIARSHPESTFVRQPRNIGAVRTLNAAIRRTTGEYVIAVATDDVWEPTLLEELVRRLDALPPDHAAVFSDASCIDEEGNRLPADFIAAHHDGPRPSGDIFDVLTEHNFIPASSVLMRRAVLAAVGEYDESLAYEDWDMWLRVSEHYRMTCVPQLLIRYRIVQGSLARTILTPQGGHPDACATHGLMARKLLRSAHLSPNARAKWRRVRLECAERLYELGDRRAAGFLREAVSDAAPRRVRMLVMAVAATLGIPRRWVAAVWAWVS